MEPVVPNTSAEALCHVFFAYDVAMAIDLEAAEKLLASIRSEREELKPTRRAPAALGYQTKPIKIALDCPKIELDGHRTQGLCEVLIFDFGALSISFHVPISEQLETLVPLSIALYDNQLLLETSRKIIERVMDIIGPALSRARIDSAVEDYIVYHLPDQAAVGAHAKAARQIVAEHSATIAQILRSESSQMSDQEVAEALSCQASYRPEDAVVVDWNAALVFDSQGEDVLAVLEFANVELLEMRALDNRLDRSVDEAYALVSRRRMGMMRRLSGVHYGGLRQIARMQVDSALLFEGVNNTIKLVGDQYLARVYRLAARRFHLPERDQTIERKLRTLEGIYEKMSSEADSMRMEALEWIIIILIAVSILIPFFLSAGSK